MRNHKTVNVKISRIELCNLITACTSVKINIENENYNAQKWTELIEKLKTQLNEFDKKFKEE